MRQRILTTALALTLGLSATAQEELWTLDRCMQYAIENSPAVKKQAYTHDTYKAERNASVASFFPSVSTNINAQYNFGRSIDPKTNTYSNTSTFNNYYGLSAELPLFTGGQIINRFLKSKSNVKMGQNDIQKRKDELSIQTLGSFVDVVYYKGTIRMAAEKLQESERTLYRAQRQEELGLKGKADVAQFEAQVAADDYALTHQENLYNTALLTLKQRMNFPSDLPLAVDTLLPEILPSPETEDVTAIYQAAEGSNPVALQAAYQLKASRYDYRIQKGALLPQIRLTAGISTNYFENLKSTEAMTGFGDQFKNNRGEYVAISMSFPLFNGLSRVTNLRRARNNMRIAEETKTEVLRQLQNEVEQSVLDREGYAKEAIRMDKQVQSNTIAYRVTVRKYEEGLMSSLDVQTSSNALITSKADLLQKRLMYLIKCRLVNYYKGTPLITLTPVP